MTDLRLPLHVRLRDDLANRLAAGEWPPGTALPAEAKLARDYRVSLQTMRRAMSHLQEEGLVDRRHGLGTFSRSAAPTASLLRFFRVTDAQGDARAAACPPTSRILSAAPAPLPAEAASRLRRAAGGPSLRLHRLRAWDGEVVLEEVIHLPLPEAEALQDLAPGDYPNLLYPLLLERCGLLVAKVEDDISVARANAAAAAALDVPLGEPVVVVARTAYDQQGQPVEARCATGRADRFRYRAVAT